jgi:hypothetical protein
MTHRPSPQLTFNPAATNKRTKGKVPGGNQARKGVVNDSFFRALAGLLRSSVKALTFATSIAWCCRLTERLPMTDNQDSYTATAPLWIVLLGIIIAIEIGALPVTRAMLVAVLP